uniref:Uncharacterized protein n=1 Tax=Phytophthora ramorum TaxID=164328 RepID=H3H414_PHYRM
MYATSSSSAKYGKLMRATPGLRISSLATTLRGLLEIVSDRCIKEAADSDFSQDERVADSHEGLRWFAYPVEAVAAFQELGGKPPLSKEIRGPCQPHRYFDPTINHVWDGVPTLATMKRHWVKMAARQLIARYCMPGQSSPFLMDMTPATDSEDESGSDSEHAQKRL